MEAKSNSIFKSFCRLLEALPKTGSPKIHIRWWNSISALPHSPTFPHNVCLANAKRQKNLSKEYYKSNQIQHSFKQESVHSRFALSLSISLSLAEKILRFTWQSRSTITSRHRHTRLFIVAIAPTHRWRIQQYQLCIAEPEVIPTRWLHQQSK